MERMKYTPPSDDQLARFAVVRTQGALSDGAVDLALRMFELSPHIKQGWLDNHRAFQELAWTATAESEGS